MFGVETNVYEKVVAIIAEQFAVSESDLSPETEFVADLDADSLDVVEIALMVETAFSLPEMKEEDLKGIKTIENLVDYITDIVGE